MIGTILQHPRQDTITVPSLTREDECWEGVAALVCTPRQRYVRAHHSPEHHSDYQVFMRGSADDWNRYAAVSEDDGWNWTNMQQYIARVSGKMEER